ncbi:MAG: sulfotransferase [Myxococcota bacterium]|nr:sulfotransferase [Myxococcota bacterium]
MAPDLDRDAEGALTYVCVPGCAYTGSTLLGFLMNAHPECASIGAATGLTPKVEVETYHCSCGERFADCGFWQRVGRRTVELGHPVDVLANNYWTTHFAPTRNRYLDGLLVRNLRNAPLEDLRDRLIGGLPPIRALVQKPAECSRALAQAILEETGKRVFVDTSRDHQRPKLLASSPRLDVRVIHLVRDARANTASILKHQTTDDTAEAARIWERANRQADAGRKHHAPEKWLTVRYDELCGDLQGTLDRISDFLGVSRAPMPEDFRAVENHIIGNEMRMGGPGQVHEDVSWKSRLSDAQLEIIQRVAGQTNRHFGFDWP